MFCKFQAPGGPSAASASRCRRDQDAPLRSGATARKIFFGSRYCTVQCHALCVMVWIWIPTCFAKPSSFQFTGKVPYVKHPTRRSFLMGPKTCRKGNLGTSFLLNEKKVATGQMGICKWTIGSYTDNLNFKIWEYFECDTCSPGIQARLELLCEPQRLSHSQRRLRNFRR